ncbi:MAG: hypothetical protein ACRDQZ_17265 [Mycobacteriales bacterium]
MSEGGRIPDSRGSGEAGDASGDHPRRGNAVQAGRRARYVLLAIERNPTGFYLDENLLYRAEDGSWMAAAGAGGGFTDRTLDDLRSAPPPQGVWDSFDEMPWPGQRPG